MKELESPLEHEPNFKTEEIIENSRWISGGDSCLGVKRRISGVANQTRSQPKCPGAKDEMVSEMMKDKMMKR